jgi:predicted metal-dependent phosphoesterase TrpH
MGLEAHYAAYTDEQRAYLNALAKQYGLIVTGGSDFHGLHKMANMGALGEVDVPDGVVEKLRKKAESVRH